MSFRFIFFLGCEMAGNADGYVCYFCRIRAKPQSLFSRTTGKNLPGGADGGSGLGEEVGKAKEDKEG